MRSGWWLTVMPQTQTLRRRSIHRLTTPLTLSPPPSFLRRLRAREPTCSPCGFWATGVHFVTSGMYFAVRWERLARILCHTAHIYLVPTHGASSDVHQSHGLCVVLQSTVPARRSSPPPIYSSCMQTQAQCLHSGGRMPSRGQPHLFPYPPSPWPLPLHLFVQ